MTTLICCLSTGKGTWMEVMDLLKAGEWDKVFLITNEFGKEKFKPPIQVEHIIINPENSVEAIKLIIINLLKNKINDFEVAVNISSGSGKEHMTVISSILKLGLGLRLISFENNKIIEV